MQINPIKVTTEDGHIYTLEFDRESVCYAEEHGFNIEEAMKFPMTGTYKLVYFALRKHHPFMSYEKAKNFVDECFGGVAGLPAGFAERLGELYAAPFGALTDGEGDGKNAKATVEM